ncbi:hypothetical protein K8354_17955 [Polaribacter litorisediminis]|uniref:hypothetical protein n=1 Tax=Polaribacter litorisediminis TaxID=1908341 RepID=UPI001CBFB756|nr:hypothetical protein [Polaribacter litorisediminis]UAM98136.1 hypothetical protein K8354_17955 [Polaribacter litorisediminis]
MELFYDRLHYNNLLDILKRNKLARESLVYMVDFKRHKDLEIKPKRYSIEIYNKDVSVVIYLFNGCVYDEYIEVKQQLNCYIIDFSLYISGLHNTEFGDYNRVKYININAWINLMIEFSEDSFCQDLKKLKKLL